MVAWETVFPHVLALVAAAALLAGCSGPCADLDRLCDSCPTGEGDVLGHCKYQVACLSDQKCDSLLEDAGPGCPYALLPSCRPESQP